MAKKKSVFFCQDCGYETKKWQGKCPGCGAWNTFVEETIDPDKGESLVGIRKSKKAEVIALKEVSLEKEDRLDTGFKELDRVLGGGIVKGSLILVGGDPGIGKSTLLLQTCRNLAIYNRDVLYISGEESERQIRMRGDRIGEAPEKLNLLCETNLEIVKSVITDRKPDFVVVDSIQTMYCEEISSAPGSVSQVRESTSVLMRLAKGLGITIFIKETSCGIKIAS